MAPVAAANAPVAAVVLAAGAATRLGAVKQILPDELGIPLVRRLVDDAANAGCAPVVAVTGAHADDVSAALVGSAALMLLNTDWESGMASSIRAAVRALRSTECSALVLIAADQPAVTAAHLSALLSTYQSVNRRVVSVYGDVRGIPAVWPRSDWDALAALHGDRGAKGLLTGTEAEVPLAFGALDLDTPRDVARWYSVRGTPAPAGDLSTSDNSGADPSAPSISSAPP